MMFKVPLFDLLMLAFLNANNPAELKPCSKEFLVSSGRYHYTPRDENNSAEPTPCSREFVMSSSRVHYTPRDEYDFIRSRIILKKYFRTERITEVAKSIESHSLPFYDGFPIYTLHRTKLVTTGHWPTLLSTKYVDRALSFTAPGYGKGRKLFASEISNSDIISAIGAKHQRFASERSRDYIAPAIETKNNFLSNDADHGLDDFIESAEDENSLPDSSEEILSGKKAHLINSGLTYNQNGNQMLIAKDTRPFNYEYSNTPLTQSILQNSIDYDTRINFNADKNYEEEQIVSSQSENQKSRSRPDFNSVSFTNTENDFTAPAILGDFFVTDKSEDEQMASNEREYEMLQEDQDSDTSHYVSFSGDGVSESNVRARQHEVLHEEQDSDTSQYGVSENNVKEHDFPKISYLTIKNEEDEQKIPNQNDKRTFLVEQDGIMESNFKVQKSKNTSSVAVKNEKEEQMVSDQVRNHILQPALDSSWLAYGTSDIDTEAHDSPRAFYAKNENLEGEQKTTEQKENRMLVVEQDSNPLTYRSLENNVKDQDFRHGSYMAITNEEDEKTTADQGKIQIPQNDQYFDSRAYSTPKTNVQVSDPLKDFHATITQGKGEINENQSEKQYAGSQSNYSLGKDFKLYDYLKNLYSNAKTEDKDKTSGQEENQIMKKHADLLPYGILGTIYKFHDYLKSLYTKSISTDEQKSSPELNGTVSNQRKEYILPTVADAVAVSYTSNLSVNEEGSSDIGYAQLSENKSFRLPRKRAHSNEAESVEAEEIDDDKEVEDDDDKEAGEDYDDKEAGEDDDDKEIGEDDGDKEAGEDDDDKEIGEDDGDKEAGEDDDDKEEGEDDDDKEGEDDDVEDELGIGNGDESGEDDDVSGKGDDDDDESNELTLPSLDEITTPPPETIPKPDASTKKPRKVRG